MPVGQHAPALRTLCIFATGSLVVGGGAWVQGGCHMDCAFGYTLSHHAAAGRLHGKGYMVGVATGKGMGWDPSVHLKEHEKLVQKSIYSYKSIR